MFFEYILLIYKGEELSPEDCCRFISGVDDLELDPHNNPNKPIVLGSNQTIAKYEDSPIKSNNFIYARHGWETIRDHIKAETNPDELQALDKLQMEYYAASFFSNTLSTMLGYETRGQSL